MHRTPPRLFASDPESGLRHDDDIDKNLSLQISARDLRPSRLLQVSAKLTDAAGDLGLVPPKSPVGFAGAIPLLQHQLDSLFFEFLGVFHPILSLVGRTPPF